MTITEKNEDEEFLNNEVHTDHFGISNVIDNSKYGTFRKVIRVTAYVQWFISNYQYTDIPNIWDKTQGNILALDK